MKNHFLPVYPKDNLRSFNVPERATEGSAGYDLRASFDKGFSPITIPPGERRLIKTNLIVEIPEGFYGRVAPRSGLAYKNGIDVMAGVIDSDYRGEVGVILINLHTEAPFIVDNDDKIAQLIIEQCFDCKFIVMGVANKTETQRADGGYGSTGTS